MRRHGMAKVVALHLGVIALLLALQFVLPPYHHTNAARIMVLATFVVGLSDGVVSVFFSPTLAKILATLLVALVLVVRPGGLFGEADN